MPSDEIIETMARAGAKAALEAGGWSYSAEDVAPGTVHHSEALFIIRAALSAAEAAGSVMVPVDLLDAVRRMLRSEYESADPGLCDCVDNDGKRYQSAFLAKQIEVVEALMPRAVVRRLTQLPLQRGRVSRADRSP